MADEGSRSTSDLSPGRRGRSPVAPPWWHELGRPDLPDEVTHSDDAPLQTMWLIDDTKPRPRRRVWFVAVAVALAMIAAIVMAISLQVRFLGAVVTVIAVVGATTVVVIRKRPRQWDSQR